MSDWTVETTTLWPFRMAGQLGLVVVPVGGASTVGGVIDVFFLIKGFPPFMTRLTDQIFKGPAVLVVTVDFA